MICVTYKRESGKPRYARRTGDGSGTSASSVSGDQYSTGQIHDS